MVKQGKYFQIARGLYETDKNVPGYLLAGSIYGPSYISFEYALSFYGIIPEYVSVYTSAVYGKKNNKMYRMTDVTFDYRSIPDDVFPKGIVIMKNSNNISLFLIFCWDFEKNKLYLSAKTKRLLFNLSFYNPKL